MPASGLALLGDWGAERAPLESVPTFPVGAASVHSGVSLGAALDDAWGLLGPQAGQFLSHCPAATL